MIFVGRYLELSRNEVIIYFLLRRLAPLTSVWSGAHSVERFFKALRGQLANQGFDNLEALEATIMQTLRTRQSNLLALRLLIYSPW